MERFRHPLGPVAPAALMGAWVCLAAPVAAAAQVPPAVEELPALAAGDAAAGELAGGEADSYRVELGAGEYLHAVVDQREIDLEVALYSPAGRELVRMDSPNAAWGPEPLWAVAETGGAYRLEVRALHATASRGAYRIAVEEIGEPTAADRLRAAGAVAYAAGLVLDFEFTADLAEPTIASLRQALALFRQAGEPQGEARALYMLGQSLYNSGDVSQVTELWNAAMALWSALGDPGAEAVTLTALGNFYQAVGEAEAALAAYDRALPLWRALGALRGQARVVGHIGALFEKWGDTEGALRLFEEALVLWRQLGDRRSEAYGLYGLARAQRLQGDLDAAVGSYGAAIELWTQLGEKYGPMAWAVEEAGWTLHRLGRSEQALARLGQALELWRQAGNLVEVAGRLVDLGDLHAAIGDDERARAFYLEALELTERLEERRHRSRGLAGLARVEHRRGDLDAARERIEEALDLSESVRTAAARHELRATYLAAQQRNYELYIELLMASHRRRPAAGHDRRALWATERARARSLLESVGEARADLHRGLSPELAAEERRLRQQLNAREFFRLQVLSRAHSADELEAAGRSLDAALAAYKALQGRIRTEAPELAAFVQPQPLSADEIQRYVLDEGTLLLEYALGEERSWLWAVTTESLASFELPPRASIEATARRAYELLTARNQGEAGEHPRDRRQRLERADAEFGSVASELSRTLLGPVAERLGERRLVVVADGALQYLPFGALPDPRPAAAGPAPLVAAHEVVALPSASVLAVQRRYLAGRPAAPEMVAVLADPVFDRDDARVAALEQSGPEPEALGDGAPVLRRAAEAVGLARFPRLRFSRREAESILELVAAPERLEALDFDASKPMVTREELGRFRLLHFATHGILNSKHPELSGLVLSLVDESGRSQDGFVRLHDIYNLDLRAELVTLSACQTALGKEVRGEGLVGLTRGFLFAGAERVVASLWSVQDQSTAELMQRLYRGILRDRLRPAEALRRAQVAMLGEERWRAPYFWAAFVLQGEWR